MDNKLIRYRRSLCVNCGKIINTKTLICDACGTDYNEKPKCDHVYGKWEVEHNPLDWDYSLFLKCDKCGELTKLKCSEHMIRDLAQSLRYRGGQLYG